MLVLVAAFAIVSIAGIAYANPFFVASKAQSATATSTQTYLVSGMATSTVVYDSYEIYGTNQTNQGNVTMANQVALVINGVASSTLSTVNINCEYSDNWNGSNGDWYENDIIVASSSVPTVITRPSQFTFTYASSTVGGAGLSGTNTKFQKLVQCPVPTRFVRAVITNTGSNVSVWAQFIPTKQRN